MLLQNFVSILYQFLFRQIFISLITVLSSIVITAFLICSFYWYGYQDEALDANGRENKEDMIRKYKNTLFVATDV